MEFLRSFARAMNDPANTRAALREFAVIVGVMAYVLGAIIIAQAIG